MPVSTSKYNRESNCESVEASIARKASKGPFPLMKLPPEICLRIYDACSELPRKACLHTGYDSLTELVINLSRRNRTIIQANREIRSHVLVQTCQKLRFMLDLKFTLNGLIINAEWLPDRFLALHPEAAHNVGIQIRHRPLVFGPMGQFYQSRPGLQTMVSIIVEKRYVRG